MSIHKTIMMMMIMKMTIIY